MATNAQHYLGSQEEAERISITAEPDEGVIIEYTHPNAGLCGTMTRLLFSCDPDDDDCPYPNALECPSQCLEARLQGWLDEECPDGD